MPTTDDAWLRAGHVAGCAELADVRLFSVTGNLSLPDTVRGLSYSLDVQVEYQTVGEDVISALIVTGNYRLAVNAAVEDGGEDDPTDVADLTFALAAMYILLEQETKPITFDEAEFEAFANTTGQFALYPYAREFVATMTGRMGLPPLHLGTLRFDRDDPADS